MTSTGFLALAGLLFFSLGVAAGAFVWWFLLPPGTYPRLLAIVPALPFWLVGWLCLRKAGLDNLRIPEWTRYLAIPLAILLFALLFSWCAGEL